MDWQLTYRTTDVLRWGAGNGGSLSWAQQDENQANLEVRVWTLETNPPTAIGISNITQSGNQLTFYLADASTFGPFTLPSANLRFRQDGWLPATGYFAGDLFVFERAGFYLVEQDHITGETFDPTAGNTDGLLYRLLFDPFSGSAPKQIPETTDLIYFPELLDANLYLIWSGDVMVTLLIPHDDDVAFAIGTQLDLRQDGLGAIAVVGDTGVTVKPSRPGFAMVTPWEGANGAVKKVAANTWHYIGPGAEST